MTRRQRRAWQETLMVAVMRLCLAVAGLTVLLILAVIVRRGLAALSWEMLTQPPAGDYYLGGGGGILNAILGSLLLAGGATLIALLLAAPLVLGLHTYLHGTRLADVIRLLLDVLWGIPSIVYGAFGFALMMALGLRASLLAGIVTLALVVLPLLARTFDEAVTLAPRELRLVTAALGLARQEFLAVLLRQTLPALTTAALLAFGRAIGDAASVLFTAGYTNALPQALDRPVASLPLAIFFQLSTPFPAVQARAYASALVLTVLILLLSLAAHLATARLGRHVIR